MPWEANGSKAIAASPTASQPIPHGGSTRWERADRTTNRSDGQVSRNRCANWAVRLSWSSHHAYRSECGPLGNRSWSVTSMQTLRVGPIGALYHHPISAVSTRLRVLVPLFESFSNATTAIWRSCARTFAPWLRANVAARPVASTMTDIEQFRVLPSMAISASQPVFLFSTRVKVADRRTLAPDN